jgi:hypothetical protein
MLSAAREVGCHCPAIIAASTGWRFLLPFLLLLVFVNIINGINLLALRPLLRQSLLYISSTVTTESVTRPRW